LLQIEHEELAAGLENPPRLVDRALRMLGVMQGLTEDREIDRLIRQRHLFDVAELVGEIIETVLLSELGADLDHAGRVIDAPHLRGATGQQLGKESLAGAEIGDRDGGYEVERQMPDGLPGSAGTVIFAEPAGDQVEILFGHSPTLLDDAIEIIA